MKKYIIATLHGLAAFSVYVLLWPIIIVMGTASVFLRTIEESERGE